MVLKVRTSGSKSLRIIIQHFIEKETYEIKTMREFVERTVDLGTYGRELHDKSLNLVRSILVEILEMMGSDHPEQCKTPGSLCGGA